MGAAQDTTSQTPDDDDAAAATPLRRYVIIVGERANSGSTFRIEDPARLLRVYSLLQAILGQLEGATLRRKGCPGCSDSSG